jgi:UDP-N-acetylglucosamine/UDP-N-acetylgalactosamine diphosphorylase
MDGLRQLLAETGQLALWEHTRQLDDVARARFLQELQWIDWRLVARLFQSACEAAATDANGLRALAARAQPPERLVRLPNFGGSPSDWKAARERGEEALRAGKVAAILVAGGQGTRLGCDLPKGMFPIGPISHKSLFQWFAEQLLARSRRYGVQIPYAIMTSDATHDHTMQFWEQNRFFGLRARDVRFFSQGNMPAVDAATGQALLAGPGQLALSPDGHGGLLAALDRNRLLHEFAERGIETLFYHQVDNPTTIVCDPAFLGWHLLEQADVSTKVVAKRSPDEKMGVAVTVDGVTQIIEYSDLPAEVAAQVDERGNLRIWAGSTAMHVFQRAFFERLLQDEAALPFHTARKAVPYWTPNEDVVAPSEPNALKFERFIFDVLPRAQRALIVEADRAAEFNPVKNKDGADSPETARAALMALHRRWLREAGAQIGDNVPVEISPLVALEATDVRPRVQPGTVFTNPLSWCE